MGDDNDPHAISSVVPLKDPTGLAPASVSVAPRPVSIAPRPSGTAPWPSSPGAAGLVAPLTGRQAPPPPSSRAVGPAPLRSTPPPPPQRSQPTASVPPAVASVAPHVNMPLRASAVPPPPPVRHPPSSSHPVPAAAPVASAVAPVPVPPGAALLLEQRLGAAQLELRKLGSERHSLRARLRREVDRVRELESALRAEADLRRQASDEHQAALAGLRARLGSLEAAEAQQRELQAKLGDATASLAALGLQLAAVAGERDQALAVAKPAAPVRASKVAEGLRRISGIGPGYQRALETLGVTRVEQIAEWSAEDIELFADSLKIRAERIAREDWVGQAKRLLGGLPAVPD